MLEIGADPELENVAKMLAAAAIQRHSWAIQEIGNVIDVKSAA